MTGTLLVTSCGLSTFTRGEVRTKEISSVGRRRDVLSDFLRVLKLFPSQSVRSPEREGTTDSKDGGGLEDDRRVVVELGETLNIHYLRKTKSVKPKWRSHTK